MAGELYDCVATAASKLENVTEKDMIDNCITALQITDLRDGLMLTPALEELELLQAGYDAAINVLQDLKNR